MTVWTQRLYLSVHVRHPYLKGVLWLLHNFGVPNFCSMSDHLNPLFSAPVRQHSFASLFSSSLSLYLVMKASKTPALEGSSSFYIPYQGMFSKGKINNNIKKNCTGFPAGSGAQLRVLVKPPFRPARHSSMPMPLYKMFSCVLVIFKQYSWPLSSRRPPTYREKTITCKCSVWSRTMPEDSMYWIILYWLNVWWCLFQVKISSLYLINYILLM